MAPDLSEVKDSGVKFDEDEEDMKDEETTNIANKAIETKESEQLQKDPEFRNWMVRARATVGAIKVVEKIC